MFRPKRNRPIAVTCSGEARSTGGGSAMADASLRDRSFASTTGRVMPACILFRRLIGKRMYPAPIGAAIFQYATFRRFLLIARVGNTRVNPAWFDARIPGIRSEALGARGAAAILC